MIELINIKKSFNEKKILTDFSFFAEKGEMVAISGSSGKGKTTLLNIMGLLVRQDSGDLIINGITNPTINSKTGVELLRNKIGYLFQDFALVENMTVNDNLKISLKYSSRINKSKSIAKALEKVGLNNFGRKKIYSLSGGEQQRVSIARLMLKNCEIVLADEPTGSLDRENASRVMGLLTEMKRDKLVIIVTHDDYVRSLCDRIVYL